MTFLQHIKHKLENISADKLIEELGYNNIKTGKQTLGTLLDSKSVYDWIKAGRYDLAYTSKQFVSKLCKLLDVSEIDYVAILDAYEQRIHEVSCVPRSYIYIDTGFKRTSEPIFTLAFMEHYRRIELDKESLFDLNEEELTSYVSTVVQKHYQKNDGKVELWGTINNYVLHNNKETPKVFSINGERLVDAVVSESRAVLKL